MDEKIIELINTGMKLKDISDQTGISYSTIRKMASLNNFINESTFLNEEQVEKLKKLGLNAVVLLPLKEGSNYLIDILEFANPETTTRNMLLDLVKNIKEINEEKLELQERYNKHINSIDGDIVRYNKLLQQFINCADSLKTEFKYVMDIKKEKPDIFKAYLQLIGIADGKYCLAKKISLSLWNKLRRAEIIKIDSAYVADEYVSSISYIQNMEKFVESTINTFKINDYYKRNSSVHGIAPIKYITIEKQMEPVIEVLKNKIEKCESEKLQLRDEILKSSKKAIKNYFEQREFRDKFINRDTLTHSKIAKGGLKWLVNNNYVGTIELKKDKYQFDVIGYKDNEIVIIEAKVTSSDLNADDKLLNYLNYCDKLYIASNNKYVCKQAMAIDDNIGVILLTDSFRVQKVLKEAINVNNGDQDLKHAINIKNSKLLAMTM